MREWSARNPDKVKAITAKRYANNRIEDNLRSKQWRAENREKAEEHWKKFHERNAHKEKEWSRTKRIKHRERIRETAKRYHAERPGLKTLWDANRRAAEKQATPKWANQFFISEAYHLAKLRERVCGGIWHVDHLVPLQSKRVCGLHVEHNLRVIPGIENVRKSNRHWPEMP
jgi:hypothetical protein